MINGSLTIRGIQILGNTNKKRQAQKIKRWTTIGLRLIVATMMFIVFAYMPFMRLGYCEPSQNIDSEVATTLRADLDRTAETDTKIEIMEVIIDSANGGLVYTEARICSVNYVYGKVINLDNIPTKANYIFNGCWTEKPTNCLPNKEWGEQYIGADGIGIKPILEDSPKVLYINWVGLEVAVKFFINNVLKVTKVGYFGCAFKDCFDFPTNKELGLPAGDVYAWYSKNKPDSGVKTPDSIIDERYKSGYMPLLGKEITEFELTVTMTIEDDATFLEDRFLPKKWNLNKDKNVYTHVYEYKKGNIPTMGTLPTPQRAGYKFQYWKDKNGEEVSSGTFVTRNYNCTPCWEAEVYEVKLSNDSEELQNISMTYGSTTADMVEVPASKEHYKFDGYYNEKGVQYFDGTGKNVRAWDIPYNATTLSAKFSPIDYSIKYNLNGGEVASENPTQYNIEDETITLSAPTKTGYNFVGWKTYENAEPQINITIPKGSYGDRNYIAVFEPNVQEEESLSITIECTNLAGQCIMVYIFDENGKLISSICMQSNKYTFVPQTTGSGYYIKIKTTTPNKLDFTLPNNCTQSSIGSTTTIFLPTEESINYTISFTATNIHIINSTFV